MAGISPDIYRELRDALSDCDPFESNRKLRNVFALTPLRPWRNNVPEADSRVGRVDAVIGYLHDQYRTDGSNALVLLLGILSQQIDSENRRHEQLLRLAQKLEQVLQGAPSAHPPRQEANPEGAPMPFIAADQKLLDCTRSVARVSVPRVVGGRMQRIPTGTGWLVTPELAFTCWHVVEARSFWDAPIREADLQVQIENSLFTFDYTLPGEGIEYGVAALAHHNPDLDYALLRLTDRPNQPLRQRGFLALDDDPPLTIQTQLFVIQHPKDQPQQRSAGFFAKKHPSNANRILHSAPTEEGTSGAPVLNVTNLRVVALHNGENEAEQLREGTLLKVILADLEQNRPDLHEEIMIAQKAKE